MADEIDDLILIRAQAYVDRKYVMRSDRRQKEMRLAYVDAERQDLAREMTRFAKMEIEIALRIKAQMERKS
jgi:hypothetical protein